MVTKKNVTHSKRVVFIGQAPARPGSKHGVPGTYVRPWLYQIGLDEVTITTYFRFYALMATFPGSDEKGHLRPTREQVAAHKPVLTGLIQEFDPDIIVPVGSMAISEVLGMSQTLNQVIGKIFTADPFGSLGHTVTIIPLPHPSGRSTWLNTNQAKLAAALQLLSEHLVN